MFDHIGIRAAQSLKQFHIRALQALGSAIVTEYPGGAVFGHKPHKALDPA